MKKNNQQPNITNRTIRKGFRQLRALGMSAEEWQKLSGRLASRTGLQAPVDYWSWFTFLNWRWTYAVAAVLIGIISGGSIAFAAQGSLPGNILYSMKVGLIEPLQETFTFSPLAKAELIANFANQRVKEGQTLAAQKKLNASAQAELSGLLTQYSATLQKTLATVAVTDPAQAAAIGDSFHADMEKRARALALFATSSIGIAAENSIPIVSPAPFVHHYFSEQRNNKADHVPLKIFIATSSLSENTIPATSTSIIVSTTSTSENNSAGFSSSQNDGQDHGNLVRANGGSDNQPILNLITSIHQSESVVGSVLSKQNNGHSYDY